MCREEKGAVKSNERNTDRCGTLRIKRVACDNLLAFPSIFISSNQKIDPGKTEFIFER